MGLEGREHLTILLVTLLLAVILGGVFSYPLALDLTSSIPASHSMTGSQRVRFMVPGDHLQLQYHFWLVEDMIFGPTPWFRNVYEFNTGSDAERFEPGAYFLPFSLIYALIAHFSGVALAWNLTILVSVWLAGYLTWLLAAQYTRVRWAQFLATAVAVALPYRWISLLGGSPAGFAMAWVPMTFLGLDAAVRTGSPLGGVLAGLGILLACFGDSHVLLFTVLGAPFVCLVALVQEMPQDLLQRRMVLQRVAALALFAAGVGLSYAFTQWVALRIEESVVAQGREISEIGLFSPRPEGVLSAGNLGISNQVFLGWSVPVLLFAGAAGVLIRAIVFWREKQWSSVLAYLLVVCVIAGVIVLALGPFGPWESRLFVGARKLIPPYRMIRQSAKIYVILPSLVAMAVATGWGGLLTERWRRVVGWVIAMALVGGMTWDFQRIRRPMLCRLAEEQGAYRAVREHADLKNIVPRALVITLWPGDSHYTSAYLYYASLYHIRLVNGYRPLVDRDYRSDVFGGLESMNQGLADNHQLDDLQKMGVQYVLFHEDLYPQKVSPFPPGIALTRLLANPRLLFMEKDGPVWAFRILDQAIEKSRLPIQCAEYLPAWLVEAETLKVQKGTLISERDTGRAKFVRFSAGDGALRGRDFKVVRFPDLRWMLRLRGRGSARVSAGLNQSVAAAEITIDSREWTWAAVPVVSKGEEFGTLPLRITTKGLVDVDQALLAAGPRLRIEPGQAVTFRPACCYHGGETDPDTGDVVLRAGRNDEGAALSAPYWPLAPAEYRVFVNFETDAPAGTKVGGLLVEGAGVIPPQKYVDMVAGKQVGLAFGQRAELPVVASVHYAGTHNLRIRSMRLERMAGPNR